MVAPPSPSSASSSPFSTYPDSTPSGDRRKEVTYPTHDPRGLPLWQAFIDAALDDADVLDAAQRPIQPFKDWLAALDPADAKARTAAEHMAEYNTTFLPAARVNSRKAYNILIRSPGVLSQRMLTKLSGSSMNRDDASRF